MEAEVRGKKREGGGRSRKAAFAGDMHRQAIAGYLATVGVALGLCDGLCVVQTVTSLQ